MEESDVLAYPKRKKILTLVPRMYKGFLAEERVGNDARTEKALASFLRPEFLNRVDEIITFRSLDENDFVKIANIMMGELRAALEEKGIQLTVRDEALYHIAKESYSHKFGARNMRRYIQTHVEDALAEKIVADYNRSITHASVGVTNGEIAVNAL